MSMMEEERKIVDCIFNGDSSAVGILADWYNEQNRNWVADKIRYYFEKYKNEPDKMCQYVLSDGLNVCPKCGSDDTAVENFDPRWRDGDVVCQKCRHNVRYFDAS